MFCPAEFCVFDEILSRLRKLIGDDRGDVFRLRLYAIFVKP